MQESDRIILAGRVIVYWGQGGRKARRQLIDDAAWGNVRKFFAKRV
jgi:hypothetical protein